MSDDLSPVPSSAEPPALSKAEWEVMKPFWERGPLAARDVFAVLSGHHDWAYKTVKTMLARLVAKGALAYEQVGNSYLYRPVYSREAMTRQEVHGFLDRVFGGPNRRGGALEAMLAHFTEDAPLSEDEVRRLRAILDRQSTAPPDKPSTTQE